MNALGLIVPKMRIGEVRNRKYSPLSEINSGEALYTVSDNRDVAFNPLLVCLMDRYFTSEPYVNLSIAQKRFIDRFLYEAGKVNDAITTGSTEPYQDMSALMCILDTYLGAILDIDDAYYYEGKQNDKTSTLKDDERNR